MTKKTDKEIDNNQVAIWKYLQSKLQNLGLIPIIFFFDVFIFYRITAFNAK